jgi:integrase
MLTAKRVLKALKRPGRYPDGFGLYLHVHHPSSASWVLRYQRRGREHMLGLGPIHAVTLKEARDRAKTARLQLLDGVDPIEQKKAVKQQQALDDARTVTFATAAQNYFEQHQPKWRNRKHRAQFLSTLKEYTFPIIGNLPVATVDTPLVLKVLEQPVAAERGYLAGALWQARPETANRVRMRIEGVLDWATVRGFRTGDNPARWKGHLDNALPPRSQITRVEHHPALPYAELPAFMKALRQRGGAAAALAFTILTAARTGEVIGAKWDEIDLKHKVWTVPAGRMKASTAHRVPLSDAAIKLLAARYHEDDNDFIFIGSRLGSGLSNMAMAAVLKRLDRLDITVHGFRSTFRDWAAEQTAYPNHVVEMALAHAIGNKVEAAYRRGDLFDKRRQLMTDWAKYCGGRS